MSASPAGQPARRPLKIFAFDPMLGRRRLNRITIDVPFEPLDPGPSGTKVQVIDYDGTRGVFYEPVDLEDRQLLMNGGLDPTESDPRFHQQMAYAVTMKVLDTFEQALGRSLMFRESQRLRIFPHAFHGANAYYDPALCATLYGHFRADARNPGSSLPGQTVFACLSQDIVAHETTHAILDRLHGHYLEPTNPDVLAFHEGFADIVAILQHFSFPEILRETISTTRTDLRAADALLALAQEFGHATGTGKALRSARDDKIAPDLYRTAFEPHERGGVLVAAIFDAFFEVYQRRIRDLVRLATGGSGVLPAGDLHPVLVNRVSLEAARTARTFLDMCIRALEYLPPCDVTFGDFLRALVTADMELVDSDELEQRNELIEAFRRRGIYPRNVVSLAPESLTWEAADAGFPRLPAGSTVDPLMAAMRVMERPRRSEWATDLPQDPRAATSKWASQLHAYATANAGVLHLDPELTIRVTGFHSLFRVAPNGRLHVENVVRFTQEMEPAETIRAIDPRRAEESDEPDDLLGGVRYRGGTTVIATVDGQVKYVISKPLSSASLPAHKRREAGERLDEMVTYVRSVDARDAWLDLYTRDRFRARHVERMTVAAADRGY